MIEDYNPIEKVPAENCDFLPKNWFSDSSVTVTKDYCDIDEFEEHTTWSVQNFLEQDTYRQPSYADSSIEQRAEYMIDFHNNFCELSGYSDNLHFSDKMKPYNYGAFDPETKEIELNVDLLRDKDPRQVMETIMHETRHAYQDFAINHPDKVSVDQKTIQEWKYNFDHYIPGELDFEAYFNQPVEADANDFAERMYEKGLSNVNS